MDALRKILNKKNSKRSSVNPVRGYALDSRASISSAESSLFSSAIGSLHDDHDRVHSLDYGPNPISKSAGVSRENSGSSRHQRTRSYVHQRHGSSSPAPSASLMGSNCTLSTFHERSIWDEMDVHNKPDDATVNDLFEKFMVRPLLALTSYASIHIHNPVDIDVDV